MRASPLDALAALYGIVPSFKDLGGVIRPTAPETQMALLRANGVDVDSPAMVQEALLAKQAETNARTAPQEVIVQSGMAKRLVILAPCDWALFVEGAEDQPIEGRAEDYIDLPALPMGIHTLQLTYQKQFETITLIAAPQTAPLLADILGQERHIWGVNTAIYGLHSAKTTGLGSYEDLAIAADALAGHGAGFLGINPVHAIGWAAGDTISPYSPSHRGFINTSHIALDHVSKAQPLGPVVDYAAHLQRHEKALEVAFAAFTGSPLFDAFCAKSGKNLRNFALFEAISEAFGANWHQWPASLHDVAGPEVQAFAAKHSERMRFHQWLQWMAETQLSAAQTRALASGMRPGLYLDLAVGARRSGAEAWCERTSIAAGVSIGAPPDHLSPAGQNWDLAAFSPTSLKATRYAAFRDILRASMRHAGILRIDHVLGLNRSFWIPDDGSAGGYIYQPFEALLAVIAIEAARANTVIVGEDLGLVPQGFRAQLHQRGLYSYSVLQYEKDDQGAFRDLSTMNPQSLVCFGTHDTPTLNGYRLGRDIEWWQKLGWVNEAEALASKTARKKEVLALAGLGAAEQKTSDKAPAFNTLSQAVHGALAQAPIAMVSVQLDDVFGEIEAQNLPGTVCEHPNWQRRAAKPIETLAHDNTLMAISQQMRKAGRCP